MYTNQVEILNVCVPNIPSKVIHGKNLMTHQHIILDGLISAKQRFILHS